jgi:hypothetical protein
VRKEEEAEGMALDERKDMRKATLEFVSEAKPDLVKDVEGWTAAIIWGRLGAGRW